MHDRGLLAPEADAYLVPVRFVPRVTLLVLCISLLRNVLDPEPSWALSTQIREICTLSFLLMLAQHTAAWCVLTWLGNGHR